jgi:hypothetical protein
MSRAGKTVFRVVALAVFAMAIAAASASAFVNPYHDDGYTMAIIGDTPYSAAQISNFHNDVDDINNDPLVHFVVHLGDIKSGKTLCTDQYFQSIRSEFDRFKDSLAYTPGDNEWTDCHRANNGSYKPTERLAKIRQVFFNHPGYTLGQNSVQVYSQAAQGFPENVFFKRAKVMWGLINLPGSNDSLIPWLAPWGDGVHVGAEQQAEHDTRLAANLKWLDSVFLRAKRANVNAVAIGLQADMFDPATPFSELSAYAPIIHKLAVKAAAWGKPVLLLNGDSHIFNVDHPWASGHQASTMFGEGTVAPNITRVTVNGSSTAPHEWLKLHISYTDPNVFSWTRVPFTHQAL